MDLEVARKQALSRFAGLLAIVDLEVTREGIRIGTNWESWRERVTDFRGCNTPNLLPNDVWTDGAESRLVFESLREQARVITVIMTSMQS